MPKILALAGRKGSGKTSVANWLFDNQSTLGVTVGLFAFADPLKELLVDVFGLHPEQVWGDRKEEKTHVLWENMPNRGEALEENKRLFGLGLWEIDPFIPRGPMTARELMQVLGTDVLRKADEKCWTRACLKRVANSSCGLAAIHDARFPDELDAVKRKGGVTGYVCSDLTRGYEPSHSSESHGHELMKMADYVLINNKGNLERTCKELVERLRELNTLP